MQREAIKGVTEFLFESLCRGLLSLLMLVLIMGVGLGVTRTTIDLFSATGHILNGTGLHEALKQLVANVLMVLAVVELFRTVKAYFTEGRVKVTYIIDTVMVVVITEIMGFWYREVEVARIALAIALVGALMGVRIMAIRFSPNRRELMDGL